MGSSRPLGLVQKPPGTCLLLSRALGTLQLHICVCLFATFCNPETSVELPNTTPLARACPLLAAHLGLSRPAVPSLGTVMSCCIHCCIRLIPDYKEAHTQRVGCRGGPAHHHQVCPTCQGENKLLFRVDGKQMNLLAVLEVRTEGNESWGGLLRLRKGKRWSLVVGLIIMSLVMASYILSGAHQELLIPSPFRYGGFPSTPGWMDGETPGDAKEHAHQPAVANVSSMRDYQSVRFIINSIAARIEFTTRQLPDLEDLRKQEEHVSSPGLPATVYGNIGGRD